MTNVSLLDQVKQLQEQDPETQEFITRYNHLLELHPDDLTVADKGFLAKYQVIGDYLYYTQATLESWMLFVPTVLRTRIILHYHTDSLY